MDQVSQMVMWFVLYSISIAWLGFFIGIVVGPSLRDRFEVWCEEREVHREILEEIRREEEQGD